MEIIRPAYYVVYASLRLVNASKIGTKLSGFNKNRDLNGTDELISTRFAEQRHLCSFSFRWGQVYGGNAFVCCNLHLFSPCSSPVYKYLMERFQYISTGRKEIVFTPAKTIGYSEYTFWWINVPRNTLMRSNIWILTRVATTSQKIVHTFHKFGTIEKVHALSYISYYQNCLSIFTGRCEFVILLKIFKISLAFAIIALTLMKLHPLISHS